MNWKDLKPDDGYFAAVNIAGEVSADLVFGLYAGGKFMKSKTIRGYQWPTGRQIGSLKRDLIFWEGVAEFMNAGGRLVDVLADIRDGVADVSPDDKLVFPGWTYFDTGVNQNGNRVHEFISNDNDIHPVRFVRWVRNEFVDYKLTEADMLEADNYVRYVGIREATDAGDLGGKGTTTERQASELAN